MTWNQIKALRESGRYQEAIDLGLQQLTDDPGDFRLRTQLDRAWYELIKKLVAGMTAKLKASQFIPSADIDKLLLELRRFAKQPKRRPDNALSNILRELVKVSSHFPEFSAFVRWVGIDGLSFQDWQYQHRDGHEYRPVALAVARALAKWVKAFPDADTADIEQALQWIERVRPSAHGDDALWLDWDTVLLLRRLDRHAQAVEVLATVIKAKRNEFWVWAEAARLYADDQPDLALACACRALECGSEPRYTVNVHRELAQMLVEREEFAQASREVAAAVEIRQQQGWRIDEPLQKLIDSSWYDPSASDAEDPKAFYASHSQQALVLCFDEVEAKPATYLGLIVPLVHKGSPPARKVRPFPRFAVRAANGASLSIVGPGVRNPHYNVGDPVTVIVGRQLGDNREAIVQITARTDGAMWDCTDSGVGVVVRETSDKKRAKLFIGRDEEEVGMDAGAWVGPQPPSLGQGVRFRVTQNPKTGRKNVFAVEPGPLPDLDIRVVNGRLRRHPKGGFAFVEDAFVAPHLVEKLDPSVGEVAALIVYGRHPTKPVNSWRAVKVSPTLMNDVT